MPYSQAPDEVFDDEAAMRHWAEMGIAAAQRARAKKGKKKPAAKN
jgi:TfoX/Sxy family transcriptional regulator of competence genes